MIEQRVPNKVERLTERVVHVQVPVDRYVEKIVEVPVENQIIKRVPQYQEQIVYEEEIVEQPVPVHRTVEKRVEHIEDVI